MRFLRFSLVIGLVISLTEYTVPSGYAAHPPLGILTQAEHAHLDAAAAFPGLSVFEGERLSTEEEGRMGVRAGHSTLALAGKTEVTLVPIRGGMHVDMDAGSLHFSAAEKEVVEVHAEEALLRPESDQATQALVTILAPKVLQIRTQHGGLNLSYREEFRNLPEGETYRIYLDAPAEPQGSAGAGAETAGGASKVTYFIVAAGAAGLTVWAIHGALSSGNNPISPAKP